MNKFNKKSKDIGYLIYRWISPVVDPIKVVKVPVCLLRYFMEWINYSVLQEAEPIEFINTYPCIFDKTQTTGFDSHYFYQDVWAFKKILHTKVDSHVDVGSRVDFVGFLTAITHVTFIDIRPLVIELENYEFKSGNIICMPFKNDSVESISCLHVAEHIGLGRYGDALDPLGTKKACIELSRILAPKGNLFFSLPVGKPRLCFNAHRIHSPRQIVDYFGDLSLIELSGINDDGKFIKDVDISILEESNYACGLFHFLKD
jgi:SAM-dependent methyltransferase